VPRRRCGPPGEACLERMRGMFALAVLDRRPGPGRERLLLARDHFGIKPLYYTWRGGRLVFASELKALLASGLVPPKVDPLALGQLLSQGSVRQPRSILEGVRMLPPAHRLLAQGGRAELARYWSLGVDRVAGLRQAPPEEQRAALRATLEESVRLQLVSDAPLGAFLSGGVDSACVVALMARHSPGVLKTFSVGYGEEGAEMDESADALATARHLGVAHSHVVVDGTMCRDALPHIAWSLDQPSVDGVNSYFVSRAAASEMRVAVSGTGGDELFAGYPWFAAMAANPRPEGFLERYAGQYRIFGPGHAQSLLAPELRAQISAGNADNLARAEAEGLAASDELAGAGPLERVSALCLRGYTGNQLLRDIDAMSMAHSLEVRVPFLDPAVADLALSLPDRAKLDPDPDPLNAPGSYRASGVKRALVGMAAPLLPPDFASRPKRGFMMPLAAWLRGPLAEAAADALSPASVARRGLLDPAAVQAVARDFAEGRTGWPFPWLLMMTELWCREVLDGAASRCGEARP